MINPRAPIRQFMTSPIRSVRPDMALSEARELMATLKLHHLPVVSDGRILGIVAANNVLIVDDFGVFGAQDVLVQGAMTCEPVCVPPDVSLRDVVHTMAQEGIEAVLVVDGGTLKGIFTDRDALRLLSISLEA